VLLDTIRQRAWISEYLEPKNRCRFCETPAAHRLNKRITFGLIVAYTDPAFRA